MDFPSACFTSREVSFSFDIFLAMEDDNTLLD
jgi:hypothetical protein